jgi:hypothetical protein
MYSMIQFRYEPAELVTWHNVARSRVETEHAPAFQLYTIRLTGRHKHEYAPRLIKHNAMKVYEGVEIQIHAFSIWALHYGERPTSQAASVVQWTEFLTADPEVPGYIPGATRFSE